MPKAKKKILVLLPWLALSPMVLLGCSSHNNGPTGQPGYYSEAAQATCPPQTGGFPVGSICSTPTGYRATLLGRDVHGCDVWQDIYGIQREGYCAWRFHHHRHDRDDGDRDGR